MDNGPDPVAQAVEVALDGGLSEADRAGEAAAARKRPLRLRLRLLVREVGREPVSLRRDRVEDRSEAETRRDHDRRSPERPPAATGDSDYDETDRQRNDRRAREGPQQARRAEDGKPDREGSQPPDGREQQQGDDEHVGGRKRRDERRDQATEEPVARVEGKVLRQPAGAVVVVAEL